MFMSFYDFFEKMYEVTLDEFKALLEIVEYPEEDEFLKTVYNDYCANKVNKRAEFLIADFLHTDDLYFC